MGTQWSYKPNDDYKTPRELIHLLVDIVAKGGNMLLNIGPRPNGKLPEVAVSRLEAIGEWMHVNGEAIHGTRPIAPYKDGKVALTRKGDVTYAIYLADADEVAPPVRISVPSIRPRSGAEVRLLGVHPKCDWRIVDDGLVIDIPSQAQVTPPCHHAWVFRIPHDVAKPQ
jgi:alpha-L-fucosidase